MLNPWLLSKESGVDVWPLLGWYQITLGQMYAESLAAIKELWGGCMSNIGLVSVHSWVDVCLILGCYQWTLVCMYGHHCVGIKEALG